MFLTLPNIYVYFSDKIAHFFKSYHRASESCQESGNFKPPWLNLSKFYSLKKYPHSVFEDHRQNILRKIDRCMVRSETSFHWHLITFVSNNLGYDLFSILLATLPTLFVLAAWSKYLLSHLGAVNLILGRDYLWKWFGEFGAQVRCYMINGTQQASFLDENVSM